MQSMQSVSHLASVCHEGLCNSAASHASVAGTADYNDCNEMHFTNDQDDVLVRGDGMSERTLTEREEEADAEQAEGSDDENGASSIRKELDKYYPGNNDGEGNPDLPPPQAASLDTTTDTSSATVATSKSSSSTATLRHMNRSGSVDGGASSPSPRRRVHIDFSSAEPSPVKPGADKDGDDDKDNNDDPRDLDEAGNDDATQSSSPSFVPAFDMQDDATVGSARSARTAPTRIGGADSVNCLPPTAGEAVPVFPTTASKAIAVAACQVQQQLEPRRMLHRPTAQGGRRAGRSPGRSNTRLGRSRSDEGSGGAGLPRPRSLTDVTNEGGDNNANDPANSMAKGGSVGSGGGASLYKIFLLLLRPTDRIFELIQVVYDPSTATVGDLLDLIPGNATEPKLGRQIHVGLCRPNEHSADNKGTGGEGLGVLTDLGMMASGAGHGTRSALFPTVGADEGGGPSPSAGIHRGEILVAIPDGCHPDKCRKLSEKILQNRRVVKLLARSDPLAPKVRTGGSSASGSGGGSGSGSGRRHHHHHHQPTSSRPLGPSGSGDPDRPVHRRSRSGRSVGHVPPTVAEGDEFAEQDPASEAGGSCCGSGNNSRCGSGSGSAGGSSSARPHREDKVATSASELSSKIDAIAEILRERERMDRKRQQAREEEERKRLAELEERVRAGEEVRREIEERARLAAQEAREREEARERAAAAMSASTTPDDGDTAYQSSISAGSPESSVRSLKSGRSVRRISFSELRISEGGTKLEILNVRNAILLVVWLVTTGGALYVLAVASHSPHLHDAFFSSPKTIMPLPRLAYQRPLSYLLGLANPDILDSHPIRDAPLGYLGLFQFIVSFYLINRFQRYARRRFPPHRSGVAGGSKKILLGRYSSYRVPGAGLSSSGGASVASVGSGYHSVRRRRLSSGVGGGGATMASSGPPPSVAVRVGGRPARIDYGYGSSPSTFGGGGANGPLPRGSAGWRQAANL